MGRIKWRVGQEKKPTRTIKEEMHIIPQEEFERGCWLMGALMAFGGCLIIAWEVGLC